MKPSIVLITTDQQRYDALGCMGNPVIRTPNLDRLAGSGILFRRAYSPSPLCVPARTSLLTGLAPGRLSATRPEAIDNATRMDPGLATVPALLSRAGYRTAIVGKMHVWPMDEPYGFDRRILSEETRFHRLGPRIGMKESQDDYDRFLEERGLFGYDKPPEIGYNEIKPLVNPLREEHHVTTWCADEAIRLLGEHAARDRETPLFLQISFVKPHVPYDPPNPWAAMYDPASLPSRIMVPPGENPLYAHSVRHHEWWMYSEEAWRLSRAFYYGLVSHIDHHVGRILDALDALGMADDTLVLFTSDHGDLLGDHGLWYKAFPHEGSMRVPFIVRAPGGSGSVREEPVDLLDATATILAAAEVAPPADAPGVDLLAGPSPRGGLVGECGVGAGRWISWTDARHKFFHYISGGYEELYDLAADPDETRNLIDTPDGRRERARIVGKIAAWLRRYANPDPVIDERGDLRVIEQRLHPLHAPGEAEGPFSRGVGSWPRVPEAYRKG